MTLSAIEFFRSDVFVNSCFVSRILKIASSRRTVFPLPVGASTTIL